MCDLTLDPMDKTIKISITCPFCAFKMAIPATQNDPGKKKQTKCPKCQKAFQFTVPASLASKFECDATKIGDGSGEFSLLLETVANPYTEYQSFELTSEYYTIGRKNSGGPEHRPDVEVATTDKMMSRKHAAIRKKGKTGFTIKDIGSKNGVFLNNTKLDVDEEVYLSDGDIFRLGDTQFRVNIAECSANENEQTC